MSDECKEILDGVPERDGNALWDATVSEFDKPTRANIRRTLRQYFHLSQKKNEFVSDYVHRSNTLLSTISSYNIAIGDEIKLVVLLNGLGGKFTDIRLILELDESVTYTSAIEKLKQCNSPSLHSTRGRVRRRQVVSMLHAARASLA